MWHLPIEDFHRIMDVEPPRGYQKCFFAFPHRFDQPAPNRIFRNGLPEGPSPHYDAIMKKLDLIEKQIDAALVKLTRD